MTTTTRVMAVFQGASNLPEDRFINVFHFFDPGVGLSGPAVWEAVTDRVREFYEEDALDYSVGGHLSPWIQRPYELIAYDLEVPQGERVPHVYAGTLPAAPTQGMPEEVALCLTLQGTPPVNQRRRGRIYIGPIGASGFQVGMADSVDRCGPNLDASQGIGQSMLRAAVVLSSYVAPFWCIRSTVPTENFVNIVGGYVDNSFDTQRRRGPKPTARTTFAQL